MLSFDCGRNCEQPSAVLERQGENLRALPLALGFEARFRFRLVLELRHCYGAGMLLRAADGKQRRPAANHKVARP